jgi:transposase
LELSDFKQKEGAAAMRSTATQYVGIDVHQATLVCVVKDESGATTIESRVATRREAIEGFIRGLGEHTHVAFEEGSQAQWLYELLRPIAERVVVCDPRKIASKGNKDDQRDAEHLSELLRLNAVQPVYHEPNGRKLKELVRGYEALVDDSLRVMLRIRAIYRSRAIAVRSRSVYQAKHRSEWLDQVTDGGGRFRAEQLYTQLDQVLALRRRARTAVLREACNHGPYRLLRTVPGIGPLRAAELIAVIADPHRFRTKRQLWAYAGLAVITRSSGDWTPDATTGRIRRTGRRPLTRGLNQNFNRLLKKIFKMAACDVTTTTGVLHDWYAQMIGRGVRPEMARLTAARKIAAVVLAVWKKGAPYSQRLIAQTI